MVQNVRLLLRDRVRLETALECLPGGTVPLENVDRWSDSGHCRMTHAQITLPVAGTLNTEGR